MQAPERVDPDLRAAWRAANVAPLWESALAHGGAVPRERARHWAWRTMRPLIDQALALRGMEVTERRVLSLIDPEPRIPGPPATITNLNAGLQILAPGESARPHRHSMNAIRFVLDGHGASTIVDGKDCPMQQGDLVITPGWTWHEHVHRGDAPIIWLDALDAPLHRYLGTDTFEPGPAHDLPNTADDKAFAFANIVPELNEPATPFSPVFRYPWSAARDAVRAAPIWKDGSRRVRYVNPMTGGSTMPLMDCHLVQIDKGSTTVRFRSTSNAVCLVCEGHGSTTVGEDTIAWEPHDVFSLPHGNWITHKADESAILFLVTDRDALRRLDLLKEQYGNEF